MASQGELQNRNKILQELLEKKKLLGQQTSVTASSFSPSHPQKVHSEVKLVQHVTNTYQGVRNPSEAHMLAQRQALEYANSISWGYFITQDSLHGNLILPVIPRFESD